MNYYGPIEHLIIRKMEGRKNSAITYYRHMDTNVIRKHIKSSMRKKQTDRDRQIDGRTDRQTETDKQTKQGGGR